MEQTESSNPASGWGFVIGGILVGFAVGVLAGPKLQAAGEEFLEGEEGDESLAQRAFKKVPTRVKVAGALGAIKGAAKEYREIQEERREDEHS